MMNRVENSDSISTDLFLEIFSRLPAKSIGRFRCVSKQWSSMLHNPDFTDLFFTKSSARPRLLFGVEQNGSGNMKWRNVQCSFTHEPFHERICINGVLYYLAQPDGYPRPYIIVCFDVRYEEFKFIDTEGFCHMFTKLVNYKGKLGAINYDSGMKNLKLDMWVLEDVEKQEWSKYVYTLPENEVVDSCHLSVAGVTASGEIVFSKELTSKPFYVFYFNPERNTLQHVEIYGNHQVLENKSRVFTFVDHVEDLTFDMMRAATSISPPEQMSTSTRKDHQLVDESKDHSLNLTLEQTMKSSRLKNEKVITEEVAKAKKLTSPAK